MKRIVLLIALCSFLVLTGCSNDESKEPAKTAAAPAEQPKMSEQAEQMAQQAKEKVAAVTEQAKEKVAAATEQAKEKVAQVEQQAKETVAQAEQQAQSMVQNAKSAMDSGDSGEAVYTKTCAACHKTGVLGAPKVGDKEAWAPLLDDGIDELVQNAINGVGKMPAKGGNSSLSDAEVKAAVEYMAGQSR